MRLERSRDMYQLPIVCFSFMNGDLGGIISCISEYLHFLYQKERRLQSKVSNFAFLFVLEGQVLT